VLRARLPRADAGLARVSATPGGTQAVLLDIEGTTTPIAFVAQTLFPYARMHLREHLEQHGSLPEYEYLLATLRDEHASDAHVDHTVPRWADHPLTARVASAASYVEWLMDRDRKSPPLKTLQGKIWEHGYRGGELAGEVFSDVPRAFVRWRDQHVSIGIFSSGSVLAQQLLFRHTPFGDLTRFLQWYFDTSVGTKMEMDSYRRIASAMALPPAAILFVSDVTRELDAACAAGMQTRLSIRPGNSQPHETDAHTVIRSFDEI
jgi:enolase-phosphatase E1